MELGSIRPRRIALSADLHYGSRHTDGNTATQKMAEYLQWHVPDLLILAGDIGAGDDFGPCLELFSKIPCMRAAIAGNHDIWVMPDDHRGNSLDVYQTFLPHLCQKHGFIYLDQEPIILADSDLAIVGNINWYDYSWSLEKLQKSIPDWEYRLQTKRFSRGRHNDANFIRWGFNDGTFTSHLTQIIQSQIDMVLSQIGQLILVTHHPAARWMSLNDEANPTLDQLLWEAFSGNSRLEKIIERHQAQIPFIFSGHTHRVHEGVCQHCRGFNIGGNYHSKRLLLLDWPEGKIEAIEFKTD